MEETTRDKMMKAVLIYGIEQKYDVKINNINDVYRCYYSGKTQNGMRCLSPTATGHVFCKLHLKYLNRYSCKNKLNFVYLI